MGRGRGLRLFRDRRASASPCNFVDQSGNLNDEERLKQRLVGAIVLVSLAVVFVPILFDVSHEANEEVLPDTDGRDPGTSAGPARTVGEHHPRDAADAAPRRPRWNANAAGTRLPPPLRRARYPDPASTSSGTAASTPVPGVSEPAGAARRSNPPSTRTEPAPAAGASDGASRKKQATAAPVAASGGWTVQLGSFRESENALALRKRLQARGYPAFVETGSTARGAVSRVFVGPIPGREQAKDSAEKLRREMALEGIVVPYSGG